MSKTVEQQMPQKGSLLVLVSLWQCVCMALACCPCLCVWRALFDLCLGRQAATLHYGIMRENGAHDRFQ